MSVKRLSALNDLLLFNTLLSDANSVGTNRTAHFAVSVFGLNCLPMSYLLGHNTVTTVEPQWLEQAWDHGNWFQSKVVPASKGKFQYL